MRARSLYASAGLHVAALLVATISWSWLRKEFVIPPPVSVEFVELSKVTETDKVALQPPKEEKKEEKPPPAARNTASEAVVPLPKQLERKPEAKKAPAEEALPDKKKKELKKKEEKKEAAAEQKDFMSVLRNLSEDDEKTDKNKEKKLTKDAAAEEGSKAPLGQKMTMSEEDALRRQLEGCWNVPFGAKDAESTVVEIYMVINQDRTLREARVVDTGRYGSDSFFRAMADSALRAVRNPLCSPFQLPPDKYETWKTVTVTFNPSEMF